MILINVWEHFEQNIDLKTKSTCICDMETPLSSCIESWFIWLSSPVVAVDTREDDLEINHIYLAWETSSSWKINPLNSTIETLIWSKMWNTIRRFFKFL